MGSDLHNRKAFYLIAISLIIVGCQPPLVLYQRTNRVVATSRNAALYPRPERIGRIRYIPVGDTLDAIGHADDFLYVRAEPENAYINQFDVIDPAASAAMAFPTEFSLPKSASDEAWGRGTFYLAEHGSMKIQVATDYLLQTYNPTASNYGYTIMRAPVGDSVHFKVSCTPGYYTEDQARGALRNAHAAAYYMSTGQLFETIISE